MCSGSWGSITGRGGSSRAREKVSWQCNQSRAEWINRRATQIDTPSCPERLHPPPALMLPQDTFSLPVMSPWQPINKHFEVISTTPLLSDKRHRVTSIRVEVWEKRTSCVSQLQRVLQSATDAMTTMWWRELSQIGRQWSWHTVEEEEHDAACLARNLYLSSTLPTRPCRLCCAYLGFHLPKGSLNLTSPNCFKV